MKEKEKVEDKMKVNLGCGIKHLKGWVNVDKLSSVNPDMTHDLNVFPYPFKTNSVDDILMDSVLEHLDNVEKVMSELYRICKDKAIITLILPYYKSFHAYTIEHLHLFNEHSFKHYSPDDEYNFQHKERFVVLKVIKGSSGKRRFIPFKSILDKFLWEIYWELTIILQVVK